MRRYRLTRAAKQDLMGIGAFYAKVNPAAGVELVQALMARFWVLNELPGLGRVRPEYLGLHAFPIRNYLILYRPYGSGIEIIRIVHQHRDIRNLLRKRS